MTPAFWNGRRVLITGHTGFKGSWLSLWLQSLGAEVHGYALTPPTDPAMFVVATVEKGLASHTIADVRDPQTLTARIQAVSPEIVFHLAAQPLVRASYANPAETYAVNVMGTVNLLDAVRRTPSVRTVVNITTDKCYENREWPWPYRENEAMGGHDPYSSSKGCAELVTAAYRSSFLAAADVGVATARAGNVIGGGDWATDRLIPDILRAIDAGDELVIRSPGAVRPWQHVLEPLSGYLRLAERLHLDPRSVAEAWNFGPSEDDARSVRWIVECIKTHREGMSWREETSKQPHEANLLKLDSSKARSRLGWSPRWSLENALAATLAWHSAWHASEDMRAFTLRQIADYQSTGERHGTV